MADGIGHKGDSEVITEDEPSETAASPDETRSADHLRALVSSRTVPSVSDGQLEGFLCRLVSSRIAVPHLSAAGVYAASRVRTTSHDSTDVRRKFAPAGGVIPVEDPVA